VNLGPSQVVTQGGFPKREVCATIFTDREVTMAIQELLRGLGLTQGQLADGMGLAESTLSQKLSGTRRWRVDEANRALAFLRQYDDTLTLDSVFGTPPLTDDTADPGAAA
jgi:transcriptional regulator with XRE-family HTH domain